MDEITMVAELRPQAPPEAELNQMRAGARRRVAAATSPSAPGTAPGRPQWWRRPLLAGGLTAIVAGATSAAVVLASGGTPATAPHLSDVVTAAWTVRQDADGTVTVDVRQMADPARLQQVLRDDGINAYVRQLQWRTRPWGDTKINAPVCDYAHTNNAPTAVQHAVVHLEFTSRSLRYVIDRAAMPAGSALFLNGGPMGLMGTPGVVSYNPVVLNNDTLPACVPYRLPTPLPANPAS